MQQSSATQSLHLSFGGLRKIAACSHSSSQCLLVSTVFGTVSSLHPTSFLICILIDRMCAHNVRIVMILYQSFHNNYTCSIIIWPSFVLMLGLSGLIMPSAVLFKFLPPQVILSEF